jgi:hypothetical protein
LNFELDSESAILFFKTAAFNQLGYSSVLNSTVFCELAVVLLHSGLALLHCSAGRVAKTRAKSAKSNESQAKGQGLLS